MERDQRFSTKLFLYALATICVVTVALVAFYLLRPTAEYYALDPYVTEEDKEVLDNSQIVIHDEEKEQKLFDVPNCLATPDNKAAKEFLSDLNRYRKEQGMQEVKTSYQLMNAATWMANDLMVRHGKDHLDTLERDPKKRIRDCGYTNGSLYELIAGGTGKGALGIWSESSKNNEILLNPNIQVIGYAHATNIADNRWVLVAGTYDDRGGVPPYPSVPPLPTVSPTATPAPSPIEIPGPPSPTTPDTQDPTPTPTPTQTP